MVFNSFGERAPTPSRYTQYALPSDTISVSTNGYAAFLERHIYLAPHLVCLFWWHVGLMLYQQSTLMELARLYIWWGMVVLTLPIVTVWAILGAVVLPIYWLAQTAIVLQVVLALVVVIAIAGLTVWALPMIKDGQFSMTGANTRTLIFILLSLILILARVYVSYPTDNGEEKHISWDDYKRICISPNGTAQTRLVTKFCVLI